MRAAAAARRAAQQEQVKKRQAELEAARQARLLEAQRKAEERCLKLQNAQYPSSSIINRSSQSVNVPARNPSTASSSYSLNKVFAGKTVPKSPAFTMTRSQRRAFKEISKSEALNKRV